MNDRKKAVHVGTVVLETVKGHLWLSLTILAVVAGAVGAALVPPLVLGRIVDGLTAGERLTLRLPLWYLAFTALAGGLESARESALTVFGQKTTHALRSRLMEKEGRLPADELNRQEPGALVSRFVGDVDTVETLFTAGIISMAADACRILSILVVVWQCSRGLAYLLLALLPVLFLFTRFVQKRMLHNQLKNRKAVSRASGYVPETVRNLRTIRTLGKETYMETRYDGALGESYRAIEGTNFYDALYSPVILTVNAAVVGAVMLLSASGDPAVLTLFGMTAGTAVTVMNYISQIFSPLESLGMEIQTIQSAVAGVRRINDFLAQPEQETVAPETENPAAPMVELRDVDFGYEAGQNVLHHLNMEIREGWLPCPVGPARERAPCSSWCWGCMPPGGAPSGFRAWIPGPSPARSDGHCTAMWSSGSIRSPAPSGTRSPCMMTPSRRGRSAGPRSWRDWRRPSAPCRRAMTPPAPRTFSLRDSGSCCPSPGRWRRTPSCFCWTRSQPIWTRRRSGRCCGP